MNSPALSEQDSIELDRALLAQGGLHDFIRMAWDLAEPGEPFVDGWHIGAVCEHLQAVSEGEIRRLAIEMPPGCMKSLTVQVFWQPWEWAKYDPSTEWAGVSYDGDLTLRDARKSLVIMESEWFRARWGDRFEIASGQAEGDFKNSRGGLRFSTSIKGKITGRHFRRIVVDDPIKPQTLSKVTLEEVERWRTMTLPTRVKPKTGAVVCIMQRLHERDFVGMIEKDPDWTILRLPMRFESKFPCVTPWGGDMRTEDGELLWPERFDAAEVDSRERVMGSRATAAQHQQRPTPEGGNVFKKSWFRFWVPPGAVLPAGETLDGVRIRGLPQKWDTLVQSWDCAFKGLDTSDFVVGQLWGKRGPDFFLLDQDKDKRGFWETLDAILRMTRRWPRALAKLVEDKANGSAVIETLQKRLHGMVPVDPDGGKEARANAVSPLCESGNVYLPHPSLFPWVDELLDSLGAFPFGANDDDVDALTQALNWLFKRASNMGAAMRAEMERQKTGVSVLQLPAGADRWKAIPNHGQGDPPPAVPEYDPIARKWRKPTC